jgi:tetrapyrrole methylase family protein / MazG family protein
MDEFKSLIDIVDRLLAPDGCPWDREQTLQSMRHLLIEECYEVIEAIDLNHDRQLEEELGDLLFNVIFLCKLAEKEKRFTLVDVIRHITAKLVRRHPHIFGEAKVSSSKEVLEQWEKIKQTENKDQKRRESALDGIPKDLPTLARAQKMMRKFDKLRFEPHPSSEGSFSPEERAGQALWDLIQQFDQQGIQVEEALRKRMMQVDKEFRVWEQ